MSAVAIRLRLLHRRLAAGLALTALVAFISGAGLETPTPLLAAAALMLAMVWAPGERLQRVLDPIWRIAAMLLAARAFYAIVVSPEDVVLPMVDLLLLLLVAETLKQSGAAGDTRVYSLSFALLIAACAYRPSVVFGLSFITFTALAIVTLTVGHFIRKVAQYNARAVPLERAFLLRVASLSVVMLALSATFFVGFPRVSRNWVMRRPVPSVSVVGFSDRVSLGEHGTRIQANGEVVLRVEFPDGAPANPEVLYWRGRSYDFFDGVAWRRSPIVPRGGPTSSDYAGGWTGRRLHQRIYALPLEIPVLFGVHPVLSVQPQSRLRALQDAVGDLWYFGEGSPIYDVSSALDPPPPDRLRAAGTDTFRGEAFFLQLPPLADRIAALADSLTTGRTSRYDAVLAIQNWLRTEFRYTLDLPPTPREATLEHFLFNRRAGHCEYFSTALAILLRTQGIPARNVNGFLGGSWNGFGGFLTVSQNEAHSWTEVYFPGYGWVPFDATPAAVAGAATLQSGGYGPLRSLVDGLEHRWNKWILEYNLEKQVDLFRRATEPFAQRGIDGRLRPSPLVERGLILVLAGGVILGALLLVVRRVHWQDLRPESRAYLKLRRSYERAGYETALHTPPIQFVAALERAEAPGHEAARRVVELYLRARFGGEDIGVAGQRELHAAARAAVSALRAA